MLQEWSVVEAFSTVKFAMYQPHSVFTILGYLCRQDGYF